MIEITDMIEIMIEITDILVAPMKLIWLYTQGKKCSIKKKMLHYDLWTFKN